MSKRILVVDDERHVRTLLEHTLVPFEEVDVVLSFAASGEDGLELCRENAPDLIFVDEGMPGIGGIAFCEAIRTEPTTRHARVVLMVDMGREADAARCNAAGIVEVITKPFDPDHVRLLTGKLLDILVEL